MLVASDYPLLRFVKIFGHKGMTLIENCQYKALLFLYLSYIHNL